MGVQSRLDLLSCCLVGRFVEDLELEPDLLSFRYCVTNLHP